MRIKHILAAEQFTVDQLDNLCKTAALYEQNMKPQFNLRQAPMHYNKILANLFYEPSTRTSSSFHAAMLKLGGNVVPITNVTYSSVAKGESLEDTIRTMACYADVIVLRHPENGAAMRAAKVSPVPIINAGDGTNEHPTQALLDYYTIQKHFNRDNLHVVMMGDLLRGRTVKSLALLLRKHDVNNQLRISWVSPPDLRVPEQFVRPNDIQTDDLKSVIAQADVVYLTRVQAERGSRSATYGIGPDDMALAKDDMLLMHPLPRLTELPTSLDDDPRAAYFKQMRNGLFMRMAVLNAVFST